MTDHEFIIDVMNHVDGHKSNDYLWFQAWQIRRLIELIDRQTLLANAILKAHKGNGHCKNCRFVEYGEDFQRCKGGEFDCCKCPACTLARSILSD